MPSHNYKLFATMNCDSHPPRLSIRQPLRELGFDLGLRYMLLFDKTTDCIVLEPDEEGLQVSQKNSNITISAVGFITDFELTGFYQADMAWWDAGLEAWMLHVTRRDGGAING